MLELLCPNLASVNIITEVMEMYDKPRYSRITDLLQLIFLMSSKLEGVTVSDIQEEFKVSRRTAERMRDAVLNILPQVDEIETNDRQKHWGFTDYSLNHLVSFSPEEIASIEKLKDSFDEMTNSDIKNVITKLRTLSNRKRGDILNNLELILQSEGIAVTQGANYKTDLNTVSLIRRAIKEQVKIKVEHNEMVRILTPLGIVYGEKVYLIAIEEDKGTIPYNYKLHKLKNLELTAEKFEKPDFDLKSFVEQSYGIFQGEIYKVKLEFDKSLAEDVLNYNFHPTQKVKELENGNVLVTFKASGDMHIIWNLFKWGNGVKILAPKNLKTQYKEYLKNVLENLK